MEKQRRNEIAFELWKARAKRTGIQLNMKRELPNIATEIGINERELLEFFREFSQELLDECFGKKA
ncbi:MAG: hypothetical protein NTZ84_03885 [Candidatus Nealsonbacteria bacterium]|nr:hypothetical protein [Candidatus Nealsonbacteria bacterium]